MLWIYVPLVGCTKPGLLRHHRGKPRLHIKCGARFATYSYRISWAERNSQGSLKSSSHIVCMGHTQHLIESSVAKGCAGKVPWTRLFVLQLCVAELHAHMLISISICQLQLPTCPRVTGADARGIMNSPAFIFFLLPPGLSVWEHITVQDKMLYLYSYKALTDLHSRTTTFFQLNLGCFENNSS